MPSSPVTLPRFRFRLPMAVRPATGTGQISFFHHKLNSPHAATVPSYTIIHNHPQTFPSRGPTRCWSLHRLQWFLRLARSHIRHRVNSALFARLLQIGMHSPCTAIVLSLACLAIPNSTTVPHSSRPLLDRSTLLSECTSFPGVLPHYKVLYGSSGFFLDSRLSVYSADSISAPPKAFYLPSVTLVSHMLYCLLTDHLFGFGCSGHGRLLLADL